MISGGSAVLGRGAGGAADIFLGVVGCEERSSAIISTNAIEAEKIICLRFDGPHTSVYDQNYKILEERGALFVDDADTFFRLHFQSFVRSLAAERRRPLSVSVDVSSMNRTMIATSLAAIFSLSDWIGSISIFYLPSVFVSPKLEFPRMERVGAVIPEFHGFDGDPRLPCALMMGLGYEYGVGVGLINQIEPRFTLCLRAVGHDERFEAAVQAANLNFDFGVSCQVGEYPLLDPPQSFRLVENICHGLTRQYRMVVVPMGPKIFTALSVLCALKYFGLISIWRVVASVSPGNAVADGRLVSLSGDIEDFVSPEERRRLSGLFLRGPQARE